MIKKDNFLNERKTRDEEKLKIIKCNGSLILLFLFILKYS